MDEYDETTYGQRIAGIYDQWYVEYDTSAIAALNRLAHGGRVLELGIGTGRIALPLRQSGVEVHGIDASQAMLAKLQGKPGGGALPVSLGNFADVAVEGRFAMVYVLFNTFFALLTQDEQVRCFENVAAHLEPKGVFVVEAFVPDMTRFSGNQSLRIVSVGDGELRLDASQHDPVAQQIKSQHLAVSEQGTRLYPVKLRYVWPAEMDLMARLAGMQLRSRWGDWHGQPFNADSRRHISIYERA